MSLTIILLEIVIILLIILIIICSAIEWNQKMEKLDNIIYMLKKIMKGKK